MTVTVYPQRIKSLALDVNTRVHKQNRIHTWGLDICGPFCFVSRGTKPTRRVDLYNRAASVAGSVSALTGLSTKYWIKDQSVSIEVTVDSGVRDRLIKEEYAKSTKEL